MTRLALALLASIGLLFGGAGGAHAQSISGPAEAIDGDTLSFTGMRIRLLGIDAVESRQSCSRAGAQWACGEDARKMLAQLVEGRQVECQGDETDVYGRLVAVCRVGSLDLGEEMVLAGLAIALPHFSEAYVATEARSRQFGQGIWNGSFDVPADWRAAHADASPRPVKAAASAPARARVYRTAQGCTIKGNRSYRGDWIYYLPGQRYYNETRPEDWFCSEQAAQQAGYRPSRAG